MKHCLHLLVLFIMAAVLSGCSLPDTFAPPNTAIISDIGTPNENPASLKTPTVPAIPALPQANVSCNQLSFYLDASLGNDYKCDTVAESSSVNLPKSMAYVFIFPTHTALTILNYPLTRTQFSPQIWVYPVSRFSELLPDYIPTRVADLERLIEGDSWSGRQLPFLPANPQIQTFSIQQAIIPFNGGQGVRYITEYTDGPFPISNRNIIYTFQGLTNDGMYWVAVTLPVSNNLLPDTDDTLPEGYTQESLSENYNAYVSKLKAELESQSPGSFFPTIEILDTLVKTITVGQ